MGRKNFLENNRGASLVLVSILSTHVIGMTAALLIVSSLIMSTSVRKTRENQAYELATSLSSKLEFYILNEAGDGVHKAQIELTDGATLVSESGFSSIPDSSVKAVVTSSTDVAGETYYIVTVTATAAGETYIKTTEYSGNATDGYTKR